MKNFDLNKFGGQKLSKQEMKAIEGGKNVFKAIADGIGAACDWIGHAFDDACAFVGL